MLAKIWKKLLLAICIIACLFNVMSKIVNRTSLEVNLKSVVGGESLTAIFKKDKDENSNLESDTIDGVINNNESKSEDNSSEEFDENNAYETVETGSQESDDADFVVIY